MKFNWLKCKSDWSKYFTIKFFNWSSEKPNGIYRFYLYKQNGVDGIKNM